MSKFLIARIQVRYGKMEEFSDGMAMVVPIMRDYKWELVYAFQTVVGPYSEVYDIWEIPDANAVGDGLAAVEKDPRFAQISHLFDESIIKSETLSVVEKTTFSP